MRVQSFNAHNVVFLTISYQMNKLLPIIVSILLLSCKENETVKTETFEGIIFNKDNYLAEPCALSLEEVNRFESALLLKFPNEEYGSWYRRKFLDTTNCPGCKEIVKRGIEQREFVIKNLSKYKRQYYGYTENDKKLVSMQAFYADKMKHPDEWKIPQYSGHRDGGTFYWQVTFDLGKDSLFNFFINSDGDSTTVKRKGP